MTKQQQADQACRKAAPHDLTSAEPTTVGAIHAITGGPAMRDGTQSHPYTWLLPPESDDAFAAWCWHQPAPKHYDLLLVGPHGEVVESGQGSVGGASPRGPLPVT